MAVAVFARGQAQRRSRPSQPGSKCAVVFPVSERLADAQREIASLKSANAKLRQIAEAERRRAEAAEDAYRRAIRVRLDLPREMASGARR